MADLPKTTLISVIIRLLACIIILKAVGVVLLSYPDYLPPNFDSEFLSGRETTFSGGYQFAFYAHVTSGPFALVLGLILISDPIRQRFPNWHRCLGRLQSLCVLLVVVPSGLWMSWYAETGALAGSGFAVLAIATGICVLRGWQLAVRRRFAAHRRWMWRCYVLLCSAVTLRLIGGIATVAEFDNRWTYPLAAWSSWLLPLAILEIWSRWARHNA